MTDREMLEMAAKAAGFDLTWRPWPAISAQGERDWTEWNPLTDDGDALRLAVKLAERYPAMVVGIFNRAAFPHAAASVVHRDGTETYVEQDAGEDLAVATRLAITRAAASIGESLSGHGMREGG